MSTTTERSRIDADAPAVLVDAPATRSAGPPRAIEFSNGDFVRVAKLGALVGIPVMSVLLTGLMWLAAPGHAGLFSAALLPALFAGWYFGAMIALTVIEMRREQVRYR